MASTLQEKAQRIAAWIEQGDEAAINHISQLLLYDGDADLRAAAAEALGRIKMDSTTRTPAIQSLSKALVDESGKVRLRAVGSLGRIGSDTAATSLSLVLQDRETSSLMLAAELHGESAHLAAATGKPLDKLRNEAWDIQFAAAESLGRIGGPSALPVLAGWSERILLSDVRVMSGEEKIEIVRAIMTNVFKMMEAGHIHEMGQRIRQTVHVLAHDESEPGSGDFGWMTLHCQNPVYSLFKEEMSRRKIEYMSSLDNRDTLFSQGEGDTKAEEAKSNLKDTLFNPISPENGTNGAPLRVETTPEQIRSQKADMLKPLNDKDALLLSRHVSSGATAPPASAKKSPGMSEDERKKKFAEYVKTLGTGDSLFVPTDMKPDSMTGGDDDASAFGDEAEPTADQKAAAYAASLGPTDTLWRPAPNLAAPEAPTPTQVASPTDSAGDDDLFGDDEPQSTPVPPPPQPQVVVPPRPQVVRVESPPPVKVPPRPEFAAATPAAPSTTPRKPNIFRRMWTGIIEFLRP